MVGIALSWRCVKSFSRDNVTEKGGRRDLTIGSLLKYRLRKRETTPRTAAVRNDSFKVKSSGMLKDSLSRVRASEWKRKRSGGEKVSGPRDYFFPLIRAATIT